MTTSLACYDTSYIFIYIHATLLYMQLKTISCTAIVKAALSIFILFTLIKLSINQQQDL